MSVELKFNIHCFDLAQAEVGPVHLDLFQLDVAQSVVDCTVVFLSIVHYLLCWEVRVFVCLPRVVHVFLWCIHLRFSHSFSPSLSYFE